LLTTLSIVTFNIQSALADTLTTPGKTVTFPDEGQSHGNIREYIGKGAPCEALSNPDNPDSAQFGRHTC
jgi:hypothetical protein